LARENEDTRHAEDEDQARGAQAAQADRLRQAQARGRVETAQARGQGPAAPPQAAQGQADRQGGRGAPERPRSILINHRRASPAGARAPRRTARARQGAENATGKRWSEDAPTAQEDPQESEGLLRRTSQALQDSRRIGAARRRLRLSRTQAEEA